MNFDEIKKISNSKYLVTVYQSIENITPQEAVKLAKIRLTIKLWNMKKLRLVLRL